MPAEDSRSGPKRPPVSICVPFLGSPDEATELLQTLVALQIGPGDELIVADNTPDGILASRASGSSVRVLAATRLRSSYYGRNLAAEAASNEWILFFDSDCRPERDILDRYFEEPIADDVGAVAGPVLPLLRSRRLMARYAASRSQNKQAPHLRNSFKPFGITANLLVRRRAWEDIGGFLEVRSGGDADFGWRLKDAGWSTDYRETASLRHYQREELRPYLRVHARNTAAGRWLALRHQGASMGQKPQRIFRAIAGAVFWPIRGQLERGLFKAIDGIVISVETMGYLFGNAGPPGAAEANDRPARLIVMVDRFPVPSQTFVVNEVRAIQALGRRVRVEARSRPVQPAIGATWDLEAGWREDAGILREVIDVAWLVARHPLRCTADLFARRRWRREEAVSPLRVLAPLARRVARDRVTHLHVHFARRAALDALRINRLLGVPYSLTAHAWDIFRQRCNLVEKIECSKFTTTGCDYNVRHLRAMVSASAGERIHKIVMGVDTEQFRRSGPYNGDGTVVAVGRLTEKKGFADLIEAAALLRGGGRLHRVVIVGDGCLREELAGQEKALGVEEMVELAGAKRPDQVRAVLERAALLAMPSVVAPDGDRDSMPVVVKEALAMGVPVVATDEVGLPEVVKPGWGRLVAPADPRALAGGIEELLALPGEERERMGRRGREFVAAECAVEDQARELLKLIDAPL